MSRKVIFYSTQDNAKKEHMSDATTFGALMGELGHTLSGSMRYYVKETRNSLENTEALLPTGDFTLVASPRNNKAAVKYESVSDIPTSTLREALTRLSNIVNTILGERGENLYEESPEEPEEETPVVDDGWIQ